MDEQALKKTSVGVVLATREELALVQPALVIFNRLGCPYELQVASVWAAPERLLAWAERAEHQGHRAILAVAGAEPQLPGFIAAATHLPVIAIPAAPVPGSAAAQASTAPAAAAAPVALVAPGASEQAALLAVRILAAVNPAWVAAIERYRHEWVERLDAAQREVTAAAEGPTPAAAAEGPRPAAAPASASAASVAPAASPSAPETQIIESEDGPVAVRSVSFNRPLSGTPARTARPAEPNPPAAPVRPPARKLGRVRIDIDAPQFDIIEDAVDCLLEGGVIAFPTETVYGLAADATNPAAVERLYELKGRQRAKAITLMVDSPKLLSGIACNLTVETRRLMEAFWPGPLTMIFQKRTGNFVHVSSADTIGVRLPDHSIPLALMQGLSRPLACTSANLAGEPDAMSADEVQRALGDKIDLILDGGGRLPENRPSTVLDVTQEPYHILRQGSVTPAQIAAIVGDKLEGEN